MEDDLLTEPLVNVCKDPGSPTKEELDDHNVKHMPYRAWCRTCVEARGTEDPHFKVKKANKNKNGKPTLCMDYKACGQSGDEENVKMQILIMRDKDSVYTFRILLMKREEVMEK